MSTISAVSRVDGPVAQNGILVAVAQMTSVGCTETNFATCKSLAEEAAAQGAVMLCLPENFNFLGTSFTESLAVAQPLDGPFMTRYRELAASTGLWLSLGGFQEAGPDPDHVFNAHIIVNSNGDVVAVYRKIHLFDVEVPNGPVLLESRFTLPGATMVCCDSPLGRLGLTTCYDLRFPELYQRLVFDHGAKILLVPSAFTVPTGEAHWEVLLRARAIETQSYVIAAAQAGQHNEKRKSYGHSMAADPWGRVVGSLEDPLATGIALVSIDMDELKDIRTKMPLLAPEATPSLGDVTPAEPEYFITIEDGNFMDGCHVFFPSGWNQWEVVEAASGAPYLSGASLPGNMTGPQLVRELLDTAKAAGLNTMRTWAFTVDEAFDMQPKPGVYNEGALRGLDYVLDEARKRGIKLILAFTSNWTPIGGVPQYLEWAGQTEQEAFFTDPAVAELYKAHVATILNRTNTINGRKYSEDPTVFAWNLINEPRCTGCTPGVIADWVKQMAPYVKSLDSNHLLTVGEDGFFGDWYYANPGLPWTNWAAEEGQNFVDDHASPDIDFATFHSWVDNWQQVTPEWQAQWIAAHNDVAQNQLKKPVLLEEFGKWYNETAVKSTLEDRDTFMQAAYDQTSQLQSNGSALKGSLFWQFYAPGQIAPLTEGGGRGLYGVYPSDTSFTFVKENAVAANKLAATAVNGCTPRPADVPSPVNCSDTWVRGEPGTGFEGPKCDVPINECVRGTATCAAEAACIDTTAGYDCVCYWGYTGDGHACAPDEDALQLLDSAYYSKPSGGACDAGADVAWPTDAPGYRYDPMGAYDSPYGSRGNVSLADCEVACQMAPECESFAYNAVQRSCFLKRSQCPVYDFCFVSQEIMCNSTDSRAGQVIEFSLPCGWWHTYYRLDMDTDAACDGFVFKGDDSAKDPTVLQTFAEFKGSAAAAHLDADRQVALVVPAPEEEEEPAAATVELVAPTTPTARVQASDLG